VTIPIMQMMAQGIAALNLRQYGIFTIAPSRIIMSGKIRMMCFDKTVRPRSRISPTSTHSPSHPLRFRFRFVFVLALLWSRRVRSPRTASA
jgi:hypothetical protein